MKRNALLLGIAIIAAAGLVFAYAARARRGAAGSAPDLLDLTPADSTLVAYADMTALRNSPLVQRLAAMAQPTSVDRDYADFVRATGFDYQRDLDRVLLAARGDAKSQTLVIADGRFNVERIEQYALRSGKLENRNGRRVYVVPSTRSAKNISLTFLSGNRMALSDEGDLLAALEAPTSKFETGSPREGANPLAAPLSGGSLHDRILRVAGTPLFVVGKAPAAAASGPDSPGGLPAGMPFAALRWVSVAAQPQGEQVMLSAEGECDSPEDARKVSSALEFLRAILHGGLSNPNARGNMPPETAVAADHLLTGVSITTDASRVRLLLPISPEMLRTQANAGGPAVPNPPPPTVPSKR